MEIRYAERKDTAIILNFIKDLAVYENMLDQVVATEELLGEWLFEKNAAEVIFAMEEALIIFLVLSSKGTWTVMMSQAS